MTGLFKRMGSFPLKKEASWVPAGGGGADMRPFSERTDCPACPREGGSRI